jgi:hypothetical protein
MTSSQPVELVVISRATAKARGYKRYYTGEPCVHGHLSERNVSGQVCLECAKLGMRKQNAKITNHVAVPSGRIRMDATLK